MDLVRKIGPDGDVRRPPHGIDCEVHT